MRTRLGRRLGAVIGAMALAGGLAGLAAPGVALASNQTVSGANTFASLDGGPQDDDLTANGTFTVTGDLTLDNGATITCNDPASPSNDPACPIDIAVGGDFVMRAASAITADNTHAGGAAGAITIVVGGNMTMCAAAGAQAGCGGASAGPGALISAKNTSGTTAGATGGDISITVGDLNTATGAFYMEGGTSGYGTETGAKILASGTREAGDIAITVGDTYVTEPGAVVEAGGPGQAQNSNGQGGQIYIVTGCELTSEGRVTSKGNDPGADLVHLEGCAVLVRGLVESTGKGHTVNNAFDPVTNPNPADPGPPFNSCDNNDDSLANEVIHADKTYNATGCVEVWGKLITIDATSPWAGELNADIGDGGADGQTWIDIYALKDLTVTDGPGNDLIRDNLGDGDSDQAYRTTYAVHANTMDGSDRTPNTVTAKVKDGPLTASGKAFESSATLTGGVGTGNLASDTGHGAGPYFVGNGSTGGTIDLEASGTVTLDTAWVNASGDFFGNTPPCDSGTGTCGSGGHIVVSAWANLSDLLWRNGVGDVRPNLSGPNGAGGTTTAGDVKLNACDTVDTGSGGTATDFRGKTPLVTNVCDATKPAIPSYVVFNTDVWAICAESTVSGTKFDDQDADGVRDGGEPGLNGWDIHLFGTDTNSNPVHMVETTAGGGNYTFAAVPPGTYTVCEEMPVVSPPWQQTYPTSGANCVTPGDPIADNANPGPLGYSVDLTGGSCCTGQEITGRDFGNVRLAIKTGIKWDDQANDGTPSFEATLDNWKIHLYGTAVNGSAVHQTTLTAGGGIYSFTVLPGSYTVCEELQATWGQTYPTSGANCVTPADPAADNPNPGPLGYAITLTEGETERGNDFANHQTPVFQPPECKEDPNRTFLQTRTVNLNLPPGGSPVNYHSIQAAYDAAANNAGEVIGLYSNTNENLTLGGAKTLTITQCTLARVTGAAGSPVWDITSTGKLTIIGPDAVGGTIGWRVVGNGGHTLKSIRANGASQYGVLVVSNGNSVSWNDVSGNGTAITDAGIRVEGSSNTLKGGTVATNKGDGVQLIGNGNNLSGSTITGNNGNGVLVAGSTNTVTSNSRINLNKLNGIYVTGSSNTLSSNASESGKGNLQNGINVTGNTNQLTDNKMNTNGQIGYSIAGSGNKLKSNNTSNNIGLEYSIGAGNVDQGGNKKNGSGFTFTNAGGTFN